ncbi:zinc phosphodiesterase ELAC protein 1 [Clonorchis sinensis]|uniref:Zinc phosphodiesterase ELAC protein 1 n=1 Tax=Clonorchis sinensis TaxID=79923 RepID=G7YLK6_CLOSI|nr:zinc phosphodiesterase ELAC protein 1 [Clonorchis sinensis]
MSFSLHLEKSAQKAFAVLRMIRRTFSRITRADFQILYGAYVRPLLEYANPVVYSGRTKDVILIECAQRAAMKMVAGIKSMDYETRLAVLDLFPLEYCCPRGDKILTYALFVQGLANRFFTADLANTRRGHGERQLLNDKNKTDPGSLGESLDPVCQLVNPRIRGTLAMLYRVCPPSGLYRPLPNTRNRGSINKLRLIDCPGRHIQLQALLIILVVDAHFVRTVILLSGLLQDFVFLGTASGYPSPDRGASGLVLRNLQNGDHWLFDCGEGTQIQAQRSSNVRLGRISNIFISHLHGDHMYGLPGLLCTIDQKGTAGDIALPSSSGSPSEAVVNIYGPQGLRRYLRLALALSRSHMNYTYAVHELILRDEHRPAGWEDWCSLEADPVRDPPLHCERPGRDIHADSDDLRPEDNAFYACEALSGPHWRAIAPTAHEGPGRLTVWFPPTDVEPRNVLTMTDADDLPQEKNKGLVYGLSHQPSKLSCQATGQPPPEWVWTGPETGPDVSLGNPDGPKGYQKVDYQDGELSVSELTIAAGYWNIGLFGTYTCTATNRLGSGMAHLRLKMATHPSRPALRACKVEAKMIELCVEPPKDTGGLPLTHYELRIQTHPRGAFYGPFAYLPGRRLLRLPHLIPGYYYRFALSAVSPAGRGPNTYLEVTTNRLSTPAIKMLTAQEYIEPTAYNVHWELPGNNGQEIDQYKINVRPVEVDYSMGEITGKPIGDWVEYTPVNPTCTKENEEMGTKPICQYRVDKLQPDKAYELELAGQNSAGFSEAQRVIFRTSSTSGTNGRMLNIPSYLRHTSGNTASVPSQTLHTMISMSLISYSLLYRLTSPSSSID